jgi:hypothetical protein
MHGFSVAVVAVAAAAGWGLFDPRSGQRQQPIARSTAAPVSTLAPSRDPQFLTVTYVLVASEEDRVIWDNVEQTINLRELLSKLAYQVLVVTNEEQEAAAYALIEATKAAYPWNDYVIEDLRTP